jgi:hypothetical protein
MMLVAIELVTDSAEEAVAVPQNLTHTQAALGQRCLELCELGPTVLLAAALPLLVVAPLLPLLLLLAMLACGCLRSPSPSALFAFLPPPALFLPMVCAALTVPSLRRRHGRSSLLSLLLAAGCCCCCCEARMPRFRGAPAGNCPPSATAVSALMRARPWWPCMRLKQLGGGRR